MKLRVKRDMMAYLNNRRYRQGEVVDIPDSQLRKADKAYIEALEAQRSKELGAVNAKNHGLKVGAIILPKWADPVGKPQGPEPVVPGSGQRPSMGKPVNPDAEADGEGEEGEAVAAGAGGDQQVL